MPDNPIETTAGIAGSVEGGVAGAVVGENVEKAIEVESKEEKVLESKNSFD